MNDADMQGAVAAEVNSRLEKATREIADKYAHGKGGVESSVDAPTGDTYKQKDANGMKARRERSARSANDNYTEDAREDALDEDGELRDDDADYELRQIREQRLRQIKQETRQKLENFSKGHGQYREIAQDEFIAEVTSSKTVICHFYHRDYKRCDIMDHHISKLVETHIESKFVKIDAEKALFFVNKLMIRTMPTVVIFDDGVAVEKIIGFEGLSNAMPEGKEDEWSTVALARLLASKRAIDASKIVDEEKIAADSQAAFQSLRATMMSNVADDDDLFDDD